MILKILSGFTACVNELSTLIHNFLYDGEYGSWCQFVWCVLASDFAICKGTFRLNFHWNSVFLLFYLFSEHVKYDFFDCDEFSLFYFL